MLLKTTRTTIGLALATAGCVALAGCGGGEEGRNAQRFDGDKAKIAQVVDELEAASRKEDAKEICDRIFAPQLKALVQSQAGTCEKRVREQQVNKDARIDVREIVIQGDKANATVKERGREAVTLNFVKQGDDWRIFSIVG